jgi:hypothetical protein
MRFKWREYPVSVRVIFGSYSIGFLVGTHTHITGIWQQGFLAVATKAPLLLNVYWDSLTLLDPLTVFLLWSRPRVGISLAILIMLTDILINTYTYATGFFGPPVPGMIPVWLLMQSLFATFVFVTAPVVMEKIPELKKELIKK